jgi:hypothetical protein
MPPSRLVACALLPAFAASLISVFQIDSGFPNELIQSFIGSSNYTLLEAALRRIDGALAPLCTISDVAVLIDPCYLYSAAQYLNNASARVDPALHFTLAWFDARVSSNASCVKVILDVYASDILTQQIGVRNGPLPPAPLRNATDTPVPGLSMDVEAVAALHEL